MSKQAFEKWHVTGIQALHSACQQGGEAAKKAQEKSTEPTLKQLAEQVVETMGRHQQVLAGYLNQAGVALNDFHDEIMDGVGRGTQLMVEAASDPESTDIALLSGGIIGADYFVISFKKSASTAQALGFTEQIDQFKQMANEQQVLVDRYTEVAEATIFPRALAS